MGSAAADALVRVRFASAALAGTRRNPYGGTDPWRYGDWGVTRAGAWIARHGWEYGFVLSYPDGKRTTSCYRYEPWHWRWVGRTTARAIHESGLVPREWLWRTGSTTPGI